MNSGAAQNSQEDLAERAGTPVRSLAEMVEHRASGRARKAELLAEAARQFSLHTRPSREDIAVFREFFYQLVDGCSKAEKRRLSAALASNPYVPRPVVLYLAVDDPEIAAPMLLFSPVLNEVDIVQLARRLGPEHLQILCRRHDLTPAAVVSLIANGGRPAIETLARNAHAACLPGVRDAQRNLRQISSGLEASESGTPAPEAPIRPAEHQLLDLAARGGRLGKGETPGQDRREADASSSPELARRLIEAARARDRHAMAIEIASKCDCPASTIEHLLGERSLETISVLMKGLAIDEVPASQLILLLRPETGRSREEMARAVRLYRRLNGAVCRQFIHSLRRIGPAPARKDRTPGAGSAFAQAISERRREITHPSPAHHGARPVAPGNTSRTFGKAGKTG